MLEYRAEKADGKMRLDVLVASLYPSFTRSSLELLFDKQMVLVNHKPAKPSYKVKPNDSVEVNETYLTADPPPIKLPVIYEDHDVIVIDKPSGMLTHSKGALNLEPSVASFIKPKITDTRLSGNRAGIVHRLDRGTSGVIIAAKTLSAQKWLQRQFSTRKAKKIYLAIVEGSPDPKKALIQAPIVRNPSRPQVFIVSATGKPADTEYEVKKEVLKDGKIYSEVELRPKTGRTHQLRVHMAYINHPIVGDPVYGHGGRGMLLHAASLELALPGGKPKQFKAKLPRRFKESLDG